MNSQILNYGQSLKDFYDPNQTDVFQNAPEQQLPQFFQSNLVDDARVVKVFHNDPQANIRIFYYQYLKLCFEIQNPHYQFHIDRIQKILTDPEFCFLFPDDEDMDQSVYNDKQFKRLMVEFFDFLSQGNCTVWKALAMYPIADAVLTSFFRSILMLYGKAQSFNSYVDRQILYEVLTSTFNVEVSLHDNCIKFVEIDLFAYEESPQQVYMIFIDYEKGIEESQSNYKNSQDLQSRQQMQSPQTLYEQNIQENQQSKDKFTYENILEKKSPGLNDNALKPAENVQKQSKEMNKKNFSYMGSSDIYDFVDYTSPKKSQEQSQNIKGTLNSLLQAKSNKYSNNLQVVVECQSNENNTNLNHSSSSFNHQQKGIQLTKSASGANQKTQSAFGSSAPKSFIENSAFGTYNLPKKEEPKFKIDDYMFTQKPKIYENYSLATTYTSDATVYSSVASNIRTQSKNKTTNFQSADITSSFIKQNPYMNCNQDFTDSFTLEKVAQPYRTTIRTIKNRARAQRKATQFLL